MTRAVTITERAPLLSVYREVWRYVLRQDGVIALVALAIGAWLLGLIPLVGGLLSVGVTLSYFFSVLRATARGSDDLPHAVEFVDWSDLIRPTMRSFLALGVAMTPLALVVFSLRESAGFAPLAVLSTLWAAAYLPGAMVAASLDDGCTGGANPLPVFELMRRIPGEYALTAGVLIALSVPAIVIQALAAQVVVPIPIVSTAVRLALSAVSMALPLMMSRILGLLLRERAEELAIDE